MIILFLISLRRAKSMSYKINKTYLLLTNLKNCIFNLFINVRWIDRRNINVTDFTRKEYISALFEIFFIKSKNRVRYSHHI